MARILNGRRCELKLSEKGERRRLRWVRRRAKTEILSFEEVVPYCLKMFEVDFWQSEELGGKGANRKTLKNAHRKGFQNGVAMTTAPCLRRMWLIESQQKGPELCWWRKISTWMNFPCCKKSWGVDLGRIDSYTRPAPGWRGPLFFFFFFGGGGASGWGWFLGILFVEVSLGGFYKLFFRFQKGVVLFCSFCMLNINTCNVWGRKRDNFGPFM